uniref:(California timema) hypothetical protein n=1 Tax=Timema californicum TaxID=61474 RepID=A0A7R9JI32_TIMCA|nr:unnamed protein product [Timema californicum]
MISDDDEDLRTLDEEFGELKRVWKLQENLFGQVSGWDDDTEGIEEETNPKESPEKEILWAAENGDLDSLRRLLSSDAQLVHVTDKDGYTPLHRACYNDHIEAVDLANALVVLSLTAEDGEIEVRISLLLQHEADVSARTEDHWQPLHSACRWNNHRSAAKLLAHGADINAASKGGTQHNTTLMI